MRTRLRAVATGTATVVVAALMTVVAPTAAQAHGATTSPGSRTFLCYTDGKLAGGDLKPNNQQCKDAIAQGGTQPLWDWFGVLRSDGAGRTEGFIPDGQLCGAGTEKWAAYNAPGTAWPATRLTSGADFRVRYNAWAAHPGQFRLYVTRDGWDPNQPLAWDDLEDEPFSVWDQTVPNGQGEYLWDVRLPAGKTGRHIIYSVWERSDSLETFYGCSDVVFDGGTGQVIGIPGYDGEPAAPGTDPVPNPNPNPNPHPHPEPDPTDPGTDPDPVPDPDPTHPHPHPDPTDPGTDPTPDPDATCTAAVTVNSWPGGYLATVTVNSTGAAAIDGWRVTAEVPAGVRLVNGWHADVTQSGNRIVAEAPQWNRQLAAGGQVSVGFVAEGPAVPGPSDITLQGSACSA